MKYKVNCIIEQQLEIEAASLEEALAKANIEDFEKDIFERGSVVYDFVIDRSDI